MDILIAILWYLQLLIPGTGTQYTADDLIYIYEDNQQAVEDVYYDDNLQQDAVQYFEDTYDPNCGVVEPWDDPPDWKPKRDPIND